MAAKEALESVIARDPNHARAAKKLRDLSKTMAHEGDSGKEDAEAVEELAEAVEELIDDEAKVDELIKQSQRVSYNRERRTTLVDGRHTTLFEEPDEADEENVYEPGFVMKDLYPLSEEIAVAEVVKFAAQGKFGTIYEVKPMPRQNTSASAGHERWAAKCARLHVVNDPAAKKQIQKDLWASAKLSFVLGAHEHLTPVRNALCMGPAFSNVHSVVVFTDFIEGSNVQTLIDNGDLYDGTPSQSLGRILGLVVQLFDGLYHVHRKSVIHQDIK